MKIQVEQRGEIALVRLDGRFDASVAEAFKTRIKELIEQDHARLVVDLAKIAFIDSSGLGALVACLRSANRAGGDIRLSGLRQEIRGIFELTRLHKLFDIHTDAERALAAFTV